jgi:hypothetical protein
MSPIQTHASQIQILIFFHIAKTAGTTLHQILRRNFPDDAMISMNYGANAGYVDELKYLSAERKAKIKYLHAHMMPLSIREYLPSSIAIALLRDPVDRVISEYFYICQAQAHPLHAQFVSHNTSLYDYITTGISPAAVQSGQTRLLSGIQGVDWATGAGPLSRDVLETAKKNLQNKFVLVGFTERFDETLVLLKHILGWKNANLLYRKHNVSQNRLPRQHIPGTVLKLIEQYNEFDIELYHFAERQFNQLIAEKGFSFNTELQLFRTYNKSYNQAHKIKELFRSMKQLL